MKLLIGPMFAAILVLGGFVEPGVAEISNQRVEGLTKQSSKQKNRKKKQEKIIDFEDELIQGEVKKPEMMHLFNKKQFNFKKLIKLRKNFIPEMKRSAEGF